MKDSHPYKIWPNAQFNLESIPVFGTEERVDFFYKYKRASENLYLGNIDKENLLLKNSQPLLESVARYFLFKQYLKENIVDNFSKRLFPKMCWLSDSFYKMGFKFPVAVHYNPRLQANVIHPGSIRNYVIKYFQESDPVNCLYFNTGGVEFDFMKTLTVVDKDYLLQHKDTMQIELVADHTAIIPHINLDPHSVKPNIVKWQEYIYRRIDSPSFTIYTNKEIDFLKQWYAPESEAYIKFEISDTTEERWEDIQCMCAILAIIGRSYTSKDLKVTHRLSFTPP